MSERLKTNSLSCGYYGRAVIDALALGARAGELLCLLGPNGCGKTTLLRALARQLKPMHGSVILDDANVWEMSARQFAQQVAIATQHEKRDWPLTVAHTVLLGRTPHRGWLQTYSAEDYAVVENMLEQFGLSTIREQPITELSGGEWRRVVLARTLTQQPRVLLLDEPTSGLDLKYQTEALERAVEMAHADGIAVVVTLHDLNLAAGYADRVILLADGKIHSTGTPDEVFTATAIESVYGVAVRLEANPQSGRPWIFPRRLG